ncbi:alpha-L-arabinofuranosidase C-terminal domain-containing protein [Actinopolymorpha pittospori]|uniref:alpha-L-arabinofuranosidase C-terminal domain-containing protein n=1 Tax=Actinopolymorpha pittospori TaxID=648752 RepID=UPI0031EF7833
MPPFPATIEIDRSTETGRIDANIYGHFLESSFFGNIEGGVFDEGSSLSIDSRDARAGLRKDVLTLCQDLGVPVVRWPGGNFTSPYHWEDGVGPRDARPSRLELAWGGVETNRFGTDEFLAWCAEVGAEPYLVHSCRDVDEAVRWVEYVNSPAETAYTRQRARNGHPDPYGVRYWGIGNEVYGPWQLGYRSAPEYAAAAREHARFMRLVDPSLKLVAVGIPWRQEEWTRPLLEQAGRLLDYVSLHLYGASTHLSAAADGSSGDDYDDYDAVVAQPLYFEQQINDYAHLVADLAADAGLERPLALALDEWNIRHLEPTGWPEPQPGEDGGFAPRELSAPDAEAGSLRVNRWSPRTLADALFYAGVFHGLHRAAGLAVAPTMANTVNLVNANGLVVARPTGATRSASYHVWDLYQNHTGPIAVAARVEGPAVSAQVRQGDNRTPGGGFQTRPGVVPYLDVSATLTEDRRSLRLAVINRHRSAPVRATIVLDGRTQNLPRRAGVHDLGVGVDDVLATNRIGEPDRVALVDRGEIEVPAGDYDFPPHSVTVLSFTLAPRPQRPVDVRVRSSAPAARPRRPWRGTPSRPRAARRRGGSPATS